MIGKSENADEEKSHCSPQSPLALHRRPPRHQMPCLILPHRPWREDVILLTTIVVRNIHETVMLSPHVYLLNITCDHWRK